MSERHNFRCGDCGRRGHNRRTCPDKKRKPTAEDKRAAARFMEEIGEPLNCRHLVSLHVGPDKEEFGPYVHPIRHLECIDCGEWMSMGPSNDIGRPYPMVILIEIRAADLADPTIVPADRMSWDEGEGWDYYEDGLQLASRWGIDDPSYRSFEFQCGYLAAAIRNHDDEIDTP